MLRLLFLVLLSVTGSAFGAGYKGIVVQWALLHNERGGGQGGIQ